MIFLSKNKWNKSLKIPYIKIKSKYSIHKNKKYNNKIQNSIFYI